MDQVHKGENAEEPYVRNDKLGSLKRELIARLYMDEWNGGVIANMTGCEPNK